jgi:hypothetical protein
MGTLALAYGSVPLYKMVSRPTVISKPYTDNPFFAFRYASKPDGTANLSKTTAPATATPRRD